MDICVLVLLLFFLFSGGGGWSLDWREDEVFLTKARAAPASAAAEAMPTTAPSIGELDLATVRAL
jgi:hypothetical protein